MARSLKWVFVLLALALFGLGFWAGGPKASADEEDEVPDVMATRGALAGDQSKWESLEFEQTIPHSWGTVFSINRVEKGGESYTFWFLAADGTLRGVTTREFTGPNRASFFPEVYVIRRK